MTAVEAPAAPVEAKASAAGRTKHKNNHQRPQEQEKRQQEHQEAKQQHAHPADSVFSQAAEDDEASTAEQRPASKPAAGKKHKQHKQKQDKQQQLHQKQEKPRKGRKRRVFGVTLLVFAVVAVTLGFGVPKAAQDERVRAAVNDSVSRLNTTLVEQFDVSLDGFLEKLANLSDTVSSIIGDDGPRPGQMAAKQGLKAHHPVVIVPGFVTSGLELWQGEECAQSYFRQRLWGTLSMAQTLLADRGCWMRHMKLDPVTGSDPPGIKLRAAKALEAVDYFVPGYWVFSKLVQSLADIGYDNNNLVAVPYDWRLPIPVMQTRDGYFTRLKTEVEMQLQQQRIKPVLVSHSYGALVTMAFMNWVEGQQPGWVDKHLHGYLNLAGPLLGLPKAVSPLLSGETRETVDMMAGLAVLVEQYLGKQSRAAMFRTWGSVLAMLPVGGPKVWGNATHAPDDDEKVTAAGRSYGGLIALVRSVDSKLRDAVTKNDSSLISSDSLQLLTKTLNDWGNMIKSFGSISISDSDDDDDDSDEERRSGAAAGKPKAGEAGGTAGATSDAGDGSAESAKEAWTSGKEKEAGNGEGGSPKDEQADVAGGRRLGGDSSEERQQQATEEAEGGEQPVRFLDVHSALLSLAATAGQQLTTNMQRWAPAAHQLDLTQVLAHHRKTALQHAAQQQKASCAVDPDQPGDYQGTCKCADSGSGADCSACDSSSSSGSCKGEVDVSSEKMRKMEQLAGVESSTASGGEETHDTEGSTGGKDEVLPINPVKTPLPHAPHFKLYCMYGVGTPTERGYHYLKSRRGGATEWSINGMVNDPASGLESGVQLSPDGDGTVPLLSLGALCAGGWRTRRLNPAGLQVVLLEYPNKPGPVLKDTRGGPGASTHVEILGNEGMLNDLLRIVSGNGEGMADSTTTTIHSIAARIPWDEL
ncbi:hypothetical protein OEZ85_013090 [Tetradesmus obliquus]|uniref:Phospholipid:diacylglycerol acyltransferase n=1 Tax=Tetradesmus obliquus TaxID=3088 RepID=A0ABY8U9S7_TETOB|nr:hypothetical protein OEZ85_013090 [Tetradesmus obliquus]